MLTAHNLTSLTTTEEREAWIQSVLDKVKHGDFTDPRFPVDDLRHKEWIDFWKFEEFIESPGEYSTSIRVVADCFGEVHYGELISSQEKKGAEQLPIPLIPGEHPLENLYGMPLNVLLLHPDSPLYIAPKKFVSNIASGGRSLLLNGVPATDDISRQMCQDLGIDPDHPQIPSALESISKEIGKEARDMYPYVGSDFMISDRNNQGVLLEINAGPGLSPEALGFPADTSKSQLREALINKILKKVA